MVALKVSADRVEGTPPRDIPLQADFLGLVKKCNLGVTKNAQPVAQSKNVSSMRQTDKTSH